MKFNKIFSFMALGLGVAFMLSSCSDDNDSNPTIITPESFEVLQPEFGESVVDLAAMTADDGITLSWNQPKYTDNGAPLGNMAGSGVVYKVMLSPSGQFTKAFDASKIDTKAGTYSGDADFDYVIIDNIYSTTKTTVLAADINLALNRWNQFTSADGVTKWEENKECDPMKVSVRVEARIEAGAGNIIKESVIESNVVTVNVKPYYQLPYVKDNPEPIYMPGNGNGWNHGVCPVLAWDDDKEALCGYAYMDGDFKFTPNDGWDAEYNGNDFDQANCSSNITLNGGGNISFTGEAGIYFVEVNLDKRTLTATPYVWRLVGDFNGWKADDDTQIMTYNKDAHCLEITGAAVTDAGWKFTSNGNWDVNYGGELNNLTRDGANITMTGSTIRLFLERTKANKDNFKFTATVE